jgi:AGZA family xanthine/uracil permease-like MFS transporter
LYIHLVLFLIDFYGSIGKFIGLTKRTNLVKKDGNPVRLCEAMYVDGIGTVAGALVGTSSIITYVVSAVGIATGGRTGITAIVCALLMFCSLIFTPLVGLIPVEATTGALVYVGWYLLPRWEWKGQTKNFGMFDVIVALAMGAISLFTFALDKAMLLGFMLYSFRQLFSSTEKANWYLMGSTILLAVSVAMQYILR